ncbi:MAG TPA: hypothetical protein VJ378_01670 [Candidatus Paceibacterota bacterium]|nr:hypothetical protein [Candidatus Paceibacterota bacterium]
MKDVWIVVLVVLVLFMAFGSFVSIKTQTWTEEEKCVKHRTIQVQQQSVEQVTKTREEPYLRTEHEKEYFIVSCGNDSWRYGPDYYHNPWPNQGSVPPPEGQMPPVPGSDCQRCQPCQSCQPNYSSRTVEKQVVDYKDVTYTENVINWVNVSKDELYESTCPVTKTKLVPLFTLESN